MRLSFACVLVSCSLLLILLLFRWCSSSHRTDESFDPVRKQTHVLYIKLNGVDASASELFTVRGASVEQMKVMCTVLPLCHGFNSEGQFKSKIASKAKSPAIDLYLKQTVLGVKQNKTLSSSEAGVFSSHDEEYRNMESFMKIYIYDIPIGKEIPSLEDYKYGVEHLFITLLSKSKFRTLDPTLATFFLIPARCTAYRKSVPNLKAGIQMASTITAEMVTHVMQHSPYWNASQGADHFYICAHDMGTRVTSAANQNLFRNAIAMVNTADILERTFVVHKDISVPPHPGRGSILWSKMGQGGAPFDPSKRVRLAFVAGNLSRGPVRPKLLELYRHDVDFLVVDGHMSDRDYMSALKTSTFCLCPRGNVVWSPRVMDALWFGCIPVIIANYYVPPLYGLVDWSAISITVPESQLSNLKDILLTVSAERVEEMQLAIRKTYEHLTWNDPPKPFDAFHSVLFQLWTKRHVPKLHPPIS